MGEEKVRVFEVAEHQEVGQDADDHQPMCARFRRRRNGATEQEIRPDREHRQQHEGRIPIGIECERRQRGDRRRRRHAPPRHQEMERNRERKEDEDEFRRVEEHRGRAGRMKRGCSERRM
jgi:hypothetical protein